MSCPNCGANHPVGTPCLLFSSNPAVNVVKTIGSSTQFLVLAILYSASVLLTALTVTMLTNQMAFGDLAAQFIYEYNVEPDLVMAIMENMNRSQVIGIITGMLPGGMIISSLWLFYCSCRNRSTGTVSTLGLTIIKVLQIIGVVFLGLAALAATAVMFIFLFAGVSAVNGIYEEAMGAVVVLAVILICALLIAFALMILYSIFFIMTINRIKKTAQTGVPDARISRFVIVMNYIMAGTTVLGALFSLAISPVNAIVSLISAASLVLIALLLSRYRGEMERLIYPPVAPVYANTQGYGVPGMPVAPSQTFQGTPPAQPVAPPPPAPPQDDPNQQQ